METIGNNQFCSDFIQGANDCREGVQHEAGKGEDYDSGYEAQYSHEQQQTELTEGRSKRLFLN